MNGIKYIGVLFTFFILLSSCCYSFTIRTYVKPDSYVDESRNPVLEPADFVINAVSLESDYPWHGVYHVVPSHYKPPKKASNGTYLNSYSPTEKGVSFVWFLEPRKPTVSFSLDLENRKSVPGWAHLDCESGFGMVPMLSVGDSTSCNAGSRRDGVFKISIIQYRIDSIEGLEYVCGLGVDPTRMGYSCVPEGDSREVVVNFSIRFGLGNSLDASEQVSDWISEPGEVTIAGKKYNIVAYYLTEPTSSTTEHRIYVGGSGLGEETQGALAGEEAPDEETQVSEPTGKSPTLSNLDDFVRGVGDCSPTIENIEVATTTFNDGKIHVCDNQGNAINNQIKVSLSYANCTNKKVCVTLWRQNPLNALVSADIGASTGSVEQSERFYYALLWWLYVIGEHDELEPFGTTREAEFTQAASQELSSVVSGDMGLFTYDTWFSHNSYTTCFDSSSTPLEFSISKDSGGNFLNPNVGSFGSSIYVTVQVLAEHTGKNIWFISRNYAGVPLELGNCAASQQAPEEPSPAPIEVSEGPTGIEQPQGLTPSSECSTCSTIIQCLACLDNLLSQSI